MPTIKQKLAVTKVLENHGNLGKAMLAAGYEENTAKNPKNLTDSKGWAELTKKYLGEERLTKKHDQLLNAESETVQLGALKLGYEVTGKINTDQKPQQNIQVNNIFVNPKVQQAAKLMDEAIKQAMYETKEST